MQLGPKEERERELQVERGRPLEQQLGDMR